MSAYDSIREKLDDGSVVLLDGAIGSELVARGVRWRWHGLLTDADRVRELHEEYLDAGADVIRTNTLQLSRRLYLNVFRDPEHMRHIGAPDLETRAHELMSRAVEMAREARDASARSAAIAGVMSPLEHCFRPDLAPKEEEALPEHEEIARALAEEGVDLLLLESMNTIGEARAAVRAANATGLPVWVSFVLGPEGEVLSGEPLREGARTARDLGVEVVLANCAPPNDVTEVIGRLSDGPEAPFGAFAHIGHFEPPSWKFEFHPQFSGTEAWPPEKYVESARMWRDRGATVIGGCCGTTPVHIERLRRAL